MDKNYIIIFMMALLLMPMSFAYYSGTTQKVGTIDYCYGEMTIKVKATKDINNGDYSIDGCKAQPDNEWKCPCINPTIISISTANESANTYTLLVQSYIAKPNITNNPVADELDNKNIVRTNTFSNIKFQVDQTVEPLVMPSFDDIEGIIIIIILVVVVIAGIVAGVIFFVNKNNKLDDDGISENELKRLEEYNYWLKDQAKKLQEQKKTMSEDIKKLKKEKGEKDNDK